MYCNVILTGFLLYAMNSKQYASCRTVECGGFFRFLWFWLVYFLLGPSRDYNLCLYRLSPQKNSKLYASCRFVGRGVLILIFLRYFQAKRWGTPPIGIHEQPGYTLRHLLLYVNIYNCNPVKVIQLSVLVTVERAFGGSWWPPPPRLRTFIIYICIIPWW